MYVVIKQHDERNVFGKVVRRIAFHEYKYNMKKIVFSYMDEDI